MGRRAAPVLTGAAAGVGAGAGAGLGGWGTALEAAWEERLSLTEGGDGSRGITGGAEVFFLLDGGTRGGGRDMGTGSPSRALYTRYMAWESAEYQTVTSHHSGYSSGSPPSRGTDNMATNFHINTLLVHNIRLTVPRGTTFLNMILYDFHRY